MALTYTLPRASDEQKHAIRLLVNNNVVIDSVAGSGKTTTVIYIAKVFAAKNILLLTYNAKLRLETRDRVNSIGLTNLEVHSYHSFAVKNINQECCTDAGIIKFIQTGEIITHSYDMIIIDEAQDMTLLYYKLCSRVVNPRTQVCVLGDKFQSIYAFNGADERFIVYASTIFGGAPLPYACAKLSTSYRITNPMATFLNKVVLKHDRLRAVKDGLRVRYVFSKFESGAYMEVKYLLGMFKPADIFILAASVKPGQHSPLRMLANRLSADGVPIYLPSDDSRRLDEEVLNGKLVFSSFHQAKGLERKCIIVFGFDTSYYEYYNKKARIDICPNELYVALTRASAHMSVIHTSNKGFLPFLDRDLIILYCDVIGDINKISPAGSKDQLCVAATELIRHIPSEVITRCMDMIKVTNLMPRSEYIDIPTKTMQTTPFGDNLYEEVSNITGAAIPAYYQYKSTGSMKIAAGIEPIAPITPAQLLLIANTYNSKLTGFVYKINQITDYSWLSQENLDLASCRLSENVRATARFEVGITLKILGRDVTGYIDAIDGDIIWEIKCTQSIQPEHILQTAIYAYMYEVLTGRTGQYRINNIISGEIVSIECDRASLHTIITTLIHQKYHVGDAMSDVEFLAQIGGEHTPVYGACAACTHLDHPVHAVEIPDVIIKPGRVKKGNTTNPRVRRKRD